MVDFNIQDRGPEEVMKKVFVPLMQEWESFSPDPSEFLIDGSTVVSLGRFACVHGATHKRADVAYAHVWDIQDGKIKRHRQYIDTLALEQARRPSRCRSIFIAQHASLTGYFRQEVVAKGTS